jgi:hypothetical protein
MAWTSVVTGVAIAVFTAISFWPSSAHAAMYSFNIPLDEAQALDTCNPNPAPANGGGTGMLTYDSNTNMLTWDVTFQNLSGAAVAAHFHGPAGAGESAGIQVSIGDLTSPSQGSAAITEAQEADLLAGHYYLNFHTAACGGGEIRGQVVTAGVGGLTGLSDTGGAPQSVSLQDSDSGISTALYAAAVAAALLCAGGALLAGQRLRRK